MKNALKKGHRVVLSHVIGHEGQEQEEGEDIPFPGIPHHDLTAVSTPQPHHQHQAYSPDHPNGAHADSPPSTGVRFHVSSPSASSSSSSSTSTSAAPVGSHRRGAVRSTPCIPRHVVDPAWTNLEGTPARWDVLSSTQLNGGSNGSSSSSEVTSTGTVFAPARPRNYLLFTRVCISTPFPRERGRMVALHCFERVLTRFHCSCAVGRRGFEYRPP